MKPEVIIKNWSIYGDPLMERRLRGWVYGHPNFKDDTFVLTSSIQDIVNCDTYKIVETRNTIYKVRPENVHPEYEKEFNNAYERLGR